VDTNQLKNYQKWVKKLRKQGLLHAKCGEWEFRAVELPKKTQKKGAVPESSDKIDGLITDESAKMPNDSEMLFFSTESFDFMRESRKDNTPR